MAGDNSLKTKRVSLTIPESTLSDIDYISKTLQISRSAFISHILTGPVAQIRHVVEHAYPETGDSPLRRSTANTAALLQGELNNLQKSITDLSDTIWEGAKDDVH